MRAERGSIRSRIAVLLVGYVILVLCLGLMRVYGKRQWEHSTFFARHIIEEVRARW